MFEWADRVQGIPVETFLYNDDSLIVILLACFFVLSSVLSDGDNFLGSILKSFFIPRADSHQISRRLRSVYMRIGMIFVSFISLALLLSVYTSRMTGVVLPDMKMILFSLALLIGLYVVKQVLFWLVNWTFWGNQHAVLWHDSYSNWIVLLGIPLYLCALLSVFMDWSIDAIVWVSAISLVLAEFALFFRAFHIFFGKRYGVLQLFVYLCTLELMPLLFLGKALVLYV